MFGAASTTDNTVVDKDNCNCSAQCVPKKQSKAGALGHPYSSRASPLKSRRSRWTVAIFLTTGAIGLFAADYMLLGKTGDGFCFPPLYEFLSMLWSVGHASKNLALDGSLSAGVVAFILFQLSQRGYLKRGGTAVPAGGQGAPRRTDASKNKHGSNRGREDSDRVAGCGATAVPTGCVPANGAASARTSPSFGQVSRLNQSIDFAARQGKVDEAARLLLEFESQSTSDSTSQPDAVSYNLVIRAAAKKGDYEGAERWLSRMEANGLEATICSYNTVLDACAKADNAEGCETWLREMQSKGVEPNVISYATAIYARARRGEEGRAEALLKQMLNAGIAPDAVCYNSMIHACGVNGNPAGAERWIKEMQSRGLEARVTTFTAVIDACAKGGDVEQAERWLKAMIGANVNPNVVTFCALIDACAKACDLARAEYWHDKMVECNVQPNAHSYSAVINACAKSGDAAKAEVWLTRSEQAGIANDVVVYSSVIDACGKVGDAERAVAVFQRMQDHGIKPHIVAYAALARPFAYRGDYVAVERISSELVAAGMVPNEYFLYAQLLSYATARPRQAQRAEHCFREAHRLGLKANDHVIGALVRAVGRERKSELMRELYPGRISPASPAIRREPGGGKARAAARQRGTA